MRERHTGGMNSVSVSAYDISTVPYEEFIHGVRRIACVALKQRVERRPQLEEDGFSFMEEESQALDYD